MPMVTLQELIPVIKTAIQTQNPDYVYGGNVLSYNLLALGLPKQIVMTIYNTIIDPNMTAQDKESFILDLINRYLPSTTTTTPTTTTAPTTSVSKFKCEPDMDVVIVQMSGEYTEGFDPVLFRGKTDSEGYIKIPNNLLVSNNLIEFHKKTDKGILRAFVQPQVIPEGQYGSVTAVLMQEPYWKLTITIPTLSDILKTAVAKTNVGAFNPWSYINMAGDVALLYSVVNGIKSKPIPGFEITAIDCNLSKNQVYVTLKETGFAFLPVAVAILLGLFAGIGLAILVNWQKIQYNLSVASLNYSQVAVEQSKLISEATAKVLNQIDKIMNDSTLTADQKKELVNTLKDILKNVTSSLPQTTTPTTTDTTKTSGTPPSGFSFTDFLNTLPNVLMILVVIIILVLIVSVIGGVRKLI